MNCIGFYSRLFCFYFDEALALNQMSPFLFNFNFLNNKKNISKTKTNSKKVVLAITDICTGGQQCKYQLLCSGVNIS